VDRVGRGRIRIASFGVSIVGGIQDDKVRACFEGDDDGLLARFLFAEAPAASDTSLDLPEDREVVEGWAATLDALANAATGQIVMLSEEAAAVRQAVERRALAIENSDAPKTWVAHAGKWGGIFLRLCLICHLIEHVDAVRAERPVPEISGDLAGRVFRLMTEWLELEAARIHFGILNRTMDRKTGGDLETVADLILRRGIGRITWGDVSRDVRALRATDPLAGAALLDTLAAHGWLSPRQSGKRAPHWIVNPAVFRAFDARRRALKGLPPQPDANPAPAPLQAAPAAVPAPGMGATREDWDAVFAAAGDDLADPCLPDGGRGRPVGL
jgi:hypothetical protein